MSQLWSTGPCLMYVGTGTTKVPRPAYLGTAKQPPRFRTEVAWENVMNDLRGIRQPIDLAYQGEFWFIIATLNKFNWPVLQRMMTRPNPAGTPGKLGPFDIGSLMLQEGYAPPFWTVFPKTKMPAYAAHPPGYHWWASVLLGPEEIDPGTQTEDVQIVVQTIPVFSTQTLGWDLYDFNMTGLPAVD